MKGYIAVLNKEITNANEETKKYFKKICRCTGVAFGYLINIYALFCICYAIYDYFFK